MASTYHVGPSDSGANPVSPVGSGRGTATNPKMRKRTKTGCLTCRKRRIKCGEERPTCANCIRSKRQCEGYNQRVVFKPPTEYGPTQTLSYHNNRLPAQHSPSSPVGPSSLQQPQSAQLTYPETEAGCDPSQHHLNAQQPPVGGLPPYINDLNYHQPLSSPHAQIPTPTSAASYLPSRPPPTHNNYPAPYRYNSATGYDVQQGYPQAGQYERDPALYDAGTETKPGPSQQTHEHPVYQHTRMDTSSAYVQRTPSIARYDSNSRGVPPVEYSQGEPPGVANAEKEAQPQLELQGFCGEDHLSPTQVLDEAAVEYEDDDYYDVLPNEDMMDGPGDEDGDVSRLHRDFSLIRRMRREGTSDLDVRRYDAFLYEGILSQYHPEQVANPLRNAHTARVFAHFIHCTGPTLSIYERNPRNPSSLFENHIPPSQQSLWTYTLPLKALKHQALLHAMLALASVHIAKLQKASVTPSYKHYAYSLKRLGRCLGNPKKRLQIPTLATALLLAFYEVTTAEHIKWSTHLVGSAHLIGEFDFRSLTQKARQLRATQASQEQQLYGNPAILIDREHFKQRMEDTIMMPDEKLLSEIVGDHISYDDFGRVYEEGSKPQESNRYLDEALDLQSYETLQDLYWYYARQDMLQSIVSGNPLIMDYSKWSDCPPRATFGRSNALYGSHDHIVLLIGRIADFIARDRVRKIEQVEVNGGYWRPTPGMPGWGNMGPPSSRGGGQGQTPQDPTIPMGRPPQSQGMGAPPGREYPSAPDQPSPRGPPPPSGPGFYGMAPTHGPAPLHSSYVSPSSSHQPHSTSSEGSKRTHGQFSNLAAAYQTALEEWNSISRAHATVSSILSNTPEFAPLPADEYPPIPGASNMTPFGPVLLHRSYGISVLWCLLHLAQILLLRGHPAMPPAAMVAAGVCAPATQPYANLIGRIAAGIPIPPPGGEDSSRDEPFRSSTLTPAMGAAHIEISVPLFFAGIQYQDPAQREWLVSRYLDMDRRTGWATASVIARSCETSWEKAADAGRGPPYKRRTRRFGAAGGYAGPGSVPLRPGNGSETGHRTSHCADDYDADLRRDGPQSRRSWKSDGERENDRRPGPARSQPPQADANETAAKTRKLANISEAGSWNEAERRFVVRRRSRYTPWALNVLEDDVDLRASMEGVGLDKGNDSLGGKRM